MSIGFINGEFVTLEASVIPIEERGHQFGDGVYEVIKTYDGLPFLLDEHLDRLEKSCSGIHLAMPYSRLEIKEIINKGLAKTDITTGQIYLQITRGIASRNHLFPSSDIPSSMTMTIKPMRHIPEEHYVTGVDTQLLPDERWMNCHIKSLNLLPNILAKQEAHNNQKFEAILVQDNYVTESTSSNVFVVKNNTLYTTPLSSNILPGITRQTILKLAKDLNIELVEENFTVDFLKNADEAFLTSTLIEVMPIRAIDDAIIGSKIPGVITKKLSQAYTKLHQTMVAKAGQ